MNQPKPIKICPECGTSFVQITKRKCYCSDKCLQNHWNQIRNEKSREQTRQAREKRILEEKLRKQAEREAERKLKQPEKDNRSERQRNQQAIIDIAVAARLAGLTYGQYVAKQNAPKVERRCRV